MRKLILIAASTLLLCKPLFADILIDDFTSGPMRLSLKCGVVDKTVKANTKGKYRYVRLQVNTPPKCKEGNPRLQLITANLNSGRFIINNGYKVRSRTEFHYGRSHTGKRFPLNLDLTEGTGKLGYLEVKFSGTASNINLNTVAHSNNGKYYGSCSINVLPNPNGFTVAFPLSKFRKAPGMTDQKFKDIDFLSMVVQTVDGNFGVKQIKSTIHPKKSSIKASC